MSGAALPAALAAILVVVAVVSGVPVLLRKDFGRQSSLGAAGQAIAAGVFLGAGLVHMLPDAVASFQGAALRFPWPFLICGVAMLLLSIMEEAAGGGSSGEDNGHALALTTALVLSIHSLLAGAALGATTQAAAIMVVFLALIAHKGAASFSLGLMLAQSRLGRACSLAVFFLFVACLPLGVALGRAAVTREHAMPLLTGTVLALGAGTFLYLGTMHAQGPRGFPGFLRLVFTAAGFALMTLIAALA